MQIWHFLHCSFLLYWPWRCMKLHVFCPLTLQRALQFFPSLSLLYHLFLPRFNLLFLHLFFPLCTHNTSCSFTQSLPRFVLLLIRFCLPPPTHTATHTHSRTHSLTLSLFFFSSPSPLLASTGELPYVFP